MIILLQATSNVDNSRRKATIYILEFKREQYDVNNNNNTWLQRTIPCSLSTLVLLSIEQDSTSQNCFLNQDTFFKQQSLFTFKCKYFINTINTFLFIFQKNIKKIFLPIRMFMSSYYGQ